MTQKTLTITKPDDWHIHLRDNDWLPLTLSHAAERFARAIVMPNLVPPVTTVELAKAYRERILSVSPHFQPLMVLYLTQDTTPALIKEAKASGMIVGVKYYPASATTHSDWGVKDLKAVYPILEAMQAAGLPLLVHGEVTDPEIDIFDREAVFIERELIPTVKQFPNLKIVFEHASTKQAVDFVRAQGKQVGATITAHHLLYTRNELLKGGLRPHLYCAPVVKTEQDKVALIAAATSGDPHFFLGTDSAPHFRSKKECSCASAGVYTAHAAIELYAEVFEQAGKLNKLEAFASFNGANFYGLPRNKEKITLSQQSWSVPEKYTVGKEELVPLRGGQEVRWKLS